MITIELQNIMVIKSTIVQHFFVTFLGGGLAQWFSVADFGPRDPGFETWPGRRSLWP